MVTFAQRLTLLRESRNLSKKDLAGVLNVSAACISQYEKNNTMPGYDILLRIAHHFNVSVDFLLGNDLSPTVLDLKAVFDGDVSYYDLLNSCAQLPIQYRKVLLTMIESLKVDISQ